LAEVGEHQHVVDETTHPTGLLLGAANRVGELVLGPEAAVLTAPIELGDVAESATIDVQATGELTIHGVTQTVAIPLQAQLVNDTIVVVGSLDMVFADYGVEVPTAPIVVSADDHGPLELQLFFTRS
jgi:hypothetical protein